MIGYLKTCFKLIIGLVLLVALLVVLFFGVSSGNICDRLLIGAPCSTGKVCLLSLVSHL